MKEMTGEEFMATLQGKDREAEIKARQRVDDAIRWVDKELRKLIAEITKLSGNSKVVPFGKLFEATVQVFEALSGTLMTAKKRGVVDYDGQLLLQGQHNHVEIELLKTEIPDSPLPDHNKVIKRIPVKGGFDSVEMGKKENCYVCTKVVYVSERIGAGGKVFHAACFRCDTCKGVLKNTDYCSVNGKVYW